MHAPDYPLIFVVEDNSNYNELIVSHLRSNEVQRIECFGSMEECLNNLYKKPDIIIQDYLMNNINDNDTIKKSKKNYRNTEFVFMSGLDNFSNTNNQDIGLVSLSESESFDVASDILKIGPHDYVVKDLNALEKLIGKICEGPQKHQKKHS